MRMASKNKRKEKDAKHGRCNFFPGGPIVDFSRGDKNNFFQRG